VFIRKREKVFYGGHHVKMPPAFQPHLQRQCKKGNGKHCGNEAKMGIKRRRRGDRRKGVMIREMARRKYVLHRVIFKVFSLIVLFPHLLFFIIHYPAVTRP
jgi:hypothetical protein